jgi:hypothetical protein
MSDPRARAFAQLGLSPGASPAQVRAQYKALVRRWHPDRFLSDPRGQAEAADRMREINAAYELILKGWPPPPPSGPGGVGQPRPAARPEPLVRSRSPFRRNAMSDSDSWEMLRSCGSGLVLLAVGIAIAVYSIRCARALRARDWAAMWDEPRMVFYPGIIAAVLVTALASFLFGRPRDDDE